jgi:hypothetical protein
VAIAALTAWSGEPGYSIDQQSAAAIRLKGASTRVDILEAPDADDEDTLTPMPPAPPRQRSAKGVSHTRSRQSEAAPAPFAATAAAPGRKSVRSGVMQSNFQPELAPVPDTVPGQVARPFRKIADIIPYDNYEPDPELAAKDPCANICPRPQGGDCPDCTKDAEGNTIPCPECPWEQELRRIGRAPGEPDRPFIPRDFAHIHYCWEPTNLYHNPIYFEDVNLERYGHTRNYLIQPVCSAVKFGVQFLALPYQMSIYPVWDRQYSLGYYRPGEFVPYKYDQIPLNAKAAVVEAGWVAGGYFLFAPGVGP